MDLSTANLRPTSPTRPMTPDCLPHKPSFRSEVWHKLQHFVGRVSSPRCMDADDMTWTELDKHSLPKETARSVRPVGVGLPRQTTFKRQNSEKRERLSPIEQQPYERRSKSSSRCDPRTAPHCRSQSTPPLLSERNSAPAIPQMLNDSSQQSFDFSQANESSDETVPDDIFSYDGSRPPRPASTTSSNQSYDDDDDDDRGNLLGDRIQLNMELDTKWILNLSMHFRDRSDREKFFVTYAESPNKWRRITVSCDYRNAEAGSLEMDLKELQFQKDKNMQIYDAIRDSLPEIQFYDTVTNLKLETSEGRLHVHVTEDINEIIPYPPRNSLDHILGDNSYRPMQVRESDLAFDAHLSGFVYRVKHQGKTYIKKEIPGPDTVDEFLYEVNALHALNDSNYVIHLEGIVFDESFQTIKGLLITYAERGAVVDLLYDLKGEIPWVDRERWARHAIQGLSNIHEEGYVQGDFTLSNIVVDEQNNAKIIDINRRGCPVGWEPPEIARKIASNQRISMYIGQKSDLYQLGMTLWALAMDDDEPERHDPPLSTQEFPSEVPAWYQEIVRICLSAKPRDRISAKELMRLFPQSQTEGTWSQHIERRVLRNRTEKRYIDPEAAVSRDDLERFRHDRNHTDALMYSPQSSREDYTFTYPKSSDYDHEYNSSSSRVEPSSEQRRLPDHDLTPQPYQHQVEMFSENEFPRANEDVSTTEDQNHSQALRSPVLDERGSRSQLGSFDNHTPVNVVSESTITGQASSHGFAPEESRWHTSSHTSETPRNNVLNLDRAGSTEFGGVESSAEAISEDLTGLGTNPSLTENSLNSALSTSLDQSDGPFVYRAPPLLAYNDSGYDEPARFGVFNENKEDPAADGNDSHHEAELRTDRHIDPELDTNTDDYPVRSDFVGANAIRVRQQTDLFNNPRTIPHYALGVLPTARTNNNSHPNTRPD